MIKESSGIRSRRKVEKQSTSSLSCRGRAKDDECSRPWAFNETKCVLFSGWFLFIYLFFNNIVTRRFCPSPSPRDLRCSLQPAATGGGDVIRRRFASGSQLLCHPMPRRYSDIDAIILYSVKIS